MPRYRPFLLTALLLPLLACATATTQAREVAAPADHVQADGPYVFRQGDQLQAKWICDDKVESRSLAINTTGLPSLTSHHSSFLYYLQSYSFGPDHHQPWQIN